jgi:RNA-binding protein
MLSGKQRAALRSLAASLDTIVHVGKGGVTDNVVSQMSDALEARELVKGRVLESAGLTAREACDMLAERCRAEPVQVIGSRFVLYRKKPDAAKSPKNPAPGKSKPKPSSALTGRTRPNAASAAAGKPAAKRTGAGPRRDAPGGAARTQQPHPRRGK